MKQEIYCNSQLRETPAKETKLSLKGDLIDGMLYGMVVGMMVTLLVKFGWGL